MFDKVANYHTFGLKEHNFHANHIALELKAQKKQVADFVEKQVSISVSSKKFEKANPTAFSKGNNDANVINLSRQMTGSGTRRIGGW